MWSSMLYIFLLGGSLVSARIPDWIQCQSGSEYTIPDDKYCDKYYICKENQVIEKFCEDGFGFVPYEGCKLLHQVGCGPRNLLQEPKGNDVCPRMYGYYPAKEGCGHFFKCYKGIPELDACPPGQMYDEVRVECRHPTLDEKITCKSSWAERNKKVFLDSVQSVDDLRTMDNKQIELVPDPDAFKCPPMDDYPYGHHSRQPIPGQCKYFLLCISDGTKKLSGCPDGQGFNSKTTICEDARNIPGCESNK
ncbi:protein obstructor-E-like [Cephus cinctus]|uniref:Protein obstructor-E-like n=1 Tax=Cephus cinctus TaxID=211228 RepID=A0AAJ7VWD8_CEPCN|nr:protein obstructor-E-like [Cephus cinctus]